MGPDLILLLCCMQAAVVLGIGDQYEPVTDDDFFYDWDQVPASRFVPYYRRNEIAGAGGPPPPAAASSANIGRTRLGQGIFRFLAGGRDAELQCEFPTHDLVSNVQWQRVTDPTGRSFSYRPHYIADHGQRDYLLSGAGLGGYYGRTAVMQRSEGASLFLRDVAPADAGVYRCLASRRVPHSVGRWAQAVETIFQDVYFFPGGGVHM